MSCVVSISTLTFHGKKKKGSMDVTVRCFVAAELWKVGHKISKNRTNKLKKILLRKFDGIPFKSRYAVQCNNANLLHRMQKQHLVCCPLRYTILCCELKKKVTNSVKKSLCFLSFIENYLAKRYIFLVL